MPASLRVALIGYGLAGRYFHAPLIRVVPELQITSVVTRDPERRAAAQRDLPSAALLDSPEELWERAGDHDIAVVATPNRRHATVALAALESGLHVVVEKPFAARAGDARQVVAGAARLGRVLTVFHNRRWDGDFLTLSALIAAGAIGSVARLESRFERWQPQPRRSAWRESPEPGAAGGLLYDLGSHLVDQAIRLFGPPTSVYAEMTTRREGVEVDDDTFLTLEHAGGVRCHLWMSSVAAIAGARYRALGSAGAYVKFGLDVQERQLRDGMRADAAEFGVEAPDRQGRLYTGGSEQPWPTERGRWTEFYPRLLRAVIDGAAPPVDPGDAVTVLEVLEAALRSAGTRSVIALG
jgi:scyllo-inositol 2-dehydrogenase (NADP+)